MTEGTPQHPTTALDDLKIGEKAYYRGTLNGAPCVVVYDAKNDKTEVVAPSSAMYANAMSALHILEMASTPVMRMKRRALITGTRPAIVAAGGAN